MTLSPSEILRRHGLKPKHSWGQNFLGDEDALSRICDALELKPGEPVVELGAGLGHLTRFLLETGAQVIAVERDRDLVKILEELKLERLTVLAANAAELSFAEAAGAAEVAVAGNLPYHLSSSILFELLDQHRTVSRAVFTLQKEVVVRLAAEPGNRDYGLLTVLLGLYFEIEHLFTLDASRFHPPPKVDSAVVRLTRLQQPRAEVVSDARFRRVVKAGFAQRRKTLLNSLKSDKTLATPAELASALERAGIDSMRRAETLSSEEFAALERALGPVAPMENESPSKAKRGMDEKGEPRSAAKKSRSAVSTERMLSASPPQVYAAFEEPERLAKWWGPSGFTNTFQTFEFKPGGRWVHVMHAPNGSDYPNESVFRELKPDERVVIDHLGEPRFQLTVTLTARGEQTHLSWVQEFASPEMAAKLRGLVDNANEQNLDRLQELLEEDSGE